MAAPDLAVGYHEVAEGCLALVVTDLEMRSPSAARAVPAPQGVTLRPVPRPDLAWYRDVFRRVGEDWLWTSRLLQDDATLGAVIHDPEVQVFTLRKDGRDEALLELDFRVKGECELAYFGLTPALIGSGAGRFLMNHAIKTAWAHDITRFHLHTCTGDSPQALKFYERSGFNAVARRVEIMRDPRLSEGWDRTLAPHLPIV